jgi:hypothetical protein
MSLVSRIQNLCGSKNTTLIGLEREVGLGRGTIRNWDKNSPSVDKVQKVAEYFGVTTDYLLYGFDKGELTSIVNIIRHKRSIKEFAQDTGLDEHYLTRLCSGVEFKQPDIETVLSIAAANKNDWLVDTRSLFEAAGYDFDEIAGELLSDIPLEHLHHYQEQGMSEAEMVIAHARYKKATFEDAMRDPGHDIQTIAAHHEGDEWTEEELAEIERFKEFVRMKRKQKQQE